MERQLIKAQTDLRFMRTLIFLLIVLIAVGGYELSNQVPDKAAAAPVITTTTSTPVPPTTVTTLADPTPTTSAYIAPPATSPALPKAVVMPPVMVRGVATCAHPNQAKVQQVNNYVGPIGPDEIKKAVCG